MEKYKRGGGFGPTGKTGKGTITSVPFTISRDFIHLNLLASGPNIGLALHILEDPDSSFEVNIIRSEEIQETTLDVRALQGKSAVIKLTNAGEQKFPHDYLFVGGVKLNDELSMPQDNDPRLQPDYGTFAVAVLDGGGRAYALVDSQQQEELQVSGRRPLEEALNGRVGQKVTLEPGETQTVSFVITWHFSNLYMPGFRDDYVKRFYGSQFKDAQEVLNYVVENYTELQSKTEEWVNNWYDSTLPYWFLDRSFANISTLATSTSYRFGNGRFWGWEGVGYCAGTCTHVWGYNHAVGFLFPELERSVREAEFKYGQLEDVEGGIGFRVMDFPRGGFGKLTAVDGQANIVIRCLREHRMSADSSFLMSNWDNIKSATQYLINEDANDGDANGLLEGEQHNTLDKEYFGPSSHLSSLYVAALFAAEQMAIVVEDSEFARRCRSLAEAGVKNIDLTLWDEELGYYIHEADPEHPDAVQPGRGSLIDQVFGQSQAYMIGLEDRVLDPSKSLRALGSLWKYNFTTNVGDYRKAYRPGRWFAEGDEGGLVMCTFPYGGDVREGSVFGANYFNECMTGFEYQAASHMIWEGMLEEGLLVVLAIHDRYAPARRNPYNEVEAGDHYARAMASYNTFLALCGFNYDGPSGSITICAAHHMEWN